MSFTVDASVVVRWLIPGEEYEDHAVKLRNDYVGGKVELNAPTLLMYEVPNVLWKAVEKNSIRIEDAVSILEMFVKIKPETIYFEHEDLRKALEIAVTNHMSFYDASYVAMAVKTKSVLITADQALHNIAKKYMKTIHLEEY